MATLLNTPADPAALFAEEIDDLMLEARNYLDGEPIANEQQAEAVSALLNRARRIKTDADDARKVEKRPHDEAAKAVQARWLPILDKAELAASTAKQALAPWLQAIEERQQAEAEAAIYEAGRLAAIARDAHAAAPTSLQAKEDADRLLKIAAAAERDAARASKQKAHAKGGERAVGLVDVFTPVLTDSCAALRHYRAEQPELLKAWLTDQAAKDIRNGVRAIPGFEIVHERNAR